MSTRTITTIDSSGRKTHTTFDSEQTGAIAVTVERADGTIESEYANGQGRGTNAPEGLQPTTPHPEGGT
jgi:hypothetical protein